MAIEIDSTLISNHEGEEDEQMRDPMKMMHWMMTNGHIHNNTMRPDEPCLFKLNHPTQSTMDPNTQLLNVIIDEEE